MALWTEQTSPADDIAPAFSDKGSREQVEDVSKAPVNRHDETEQSMNVRTWMAFVAMAFLWAGSQIPLYLFGGIPPYVYRDLGGVDRWTWSATYPFVGALSDLIGRRYVAILGAAVVSLFWG